MLLKGYIQEYLCIYYTYMHVIAINEKGSHEFERKRRGVYERTWKEQKEEMMLLCHNLKYRRKKIIFKSNHFNTNETIFKCQ